MHSLTAARHERPAIAAIVLVAHLLVAWLWVLMSREHLPAPDPVSESVPTYVRIFEEPRPEPLGTPAPVKLTLVPVTRPKFSTPELQLIEIETLDSPAPGPDPAPSSAQVVTRPGPANAGGQGYPVSKGNQALRLLRRVAPVYPTASAQRGEEGVVQMLAHVDERGRVVEVQLLRSSGFQRLDEAATRAVGKWRFEPLVQDGRPVSAWTQVNLGLSVYQQKYCRIREGPADQSTGELVHDGAAAAGTLGNEAALKKLVDDLASGSPGMLGPVGALLRDWGPVQSVHYANDAGYQGWVSREVLPAYQEGHAGTVQVRWDTYVVQHERRTAMWRVATDPTGDIWCVHVGPAR